MNSIDRFAELPEGPIQLVVFDLDGVPRGKRISKQKLLQGAEHGFGFCNVVFGWDSGDVPYDNSIASGWHTGYPDAKVCLDTKTLRQIPWEGGLQLVLGDFSGGSLAEVCPRTILKQVLAKAAGMGYQVNAALEYEFFLFAETPTSLAAKQGAPPEPATPGMHGYSLLRPTSHAEFVEALWSGMEEFDVPLEGLHTETGPGVYEVAMHYTDALAAADRAALFKLGTKQVALQHHRLASFMAKWRDDLPGCGGHLHQSLVDQSGRNLFVGQSPAAAAYVAGQLYWLPKLLPLFAPTINSYKRLVPGSWAATAATWGNDNRTTALRLLDNRLETRVPGADANPYLVLAAAVAAGLYGIEHRLKLTAPVHGNAYETITAPPLPRTLQAATAAMRAAEEELTELFPAAFVDHFLRTREWECKQAEAAVTDWERRRYLEII